MTQIMGFKEFLLESEKQIALDLEYKDYTKALELFEQYHYGILEESILDHLPSGIKAKLDFIKEIATYIKNVEFEDIVTIFNNSHIYELFKEFKWDLKHIMKIFHEGLNLYKELHNIIFKWLHDKGISKWNEELIKDLQQFLLKHPVWKKLGGVAVAGLLLYALLNSLDLGHPSDFDITDIVLALKGHYDLYSLFGGAGGLKFITHLFIAASGASVVNYGIGIGKILLAMLYTSLKHSPIAKTLLADFKATH